MFALPFALTGALLASRHVPLTWDRVAWIVVAMVGARSAAMGFNRLVDARYDGAESADRRAGTAGGPHEPARSRRCLWPCRPRCSSGRPTGSARSASRCRRSPWPSSSGTRSPSASPGRRRRSWGSRWPSPRSEAGWPRAGAAAGSRGCWRVAIGTWVGGFDVLYACQDLEFDRAHGLRSIPQRFGVAASLAISRGLHVVTVAALAALAWVAPLGPIYLAGVAGVAALLAFEQSLVSADRPLARQVGV